MAGTGNKLLVLAKLLRQLWGAGFVLLLATLLSPASLHAAAPDDQLVRLHFKDQSQLQTWIDSGLDVWQVDGNTALVAVARNQWRVLEAEGIAPTPVTELAWVSFPAGYRTYDDMATFFHERQARYPSLFQLVDVGDSWEKQTGLANRDLYVVRLTSPQRPENKPKLFLVAEHHAREIMTPEIAMDFIDELLEGYGQDPTATWLLDHREVWVMPMANPDGHARAAQMENWRKNANRTDACNQGAPPNSYGVDLSRNYDYEWGLPTGSSTEPCNLTYRGQAPFSEPEIQAVRDLVREQRFDILVSLHSYGDLILYPWAYTWHPAPDAASLSALANRMAAGSGYTAMPATGIGYLTSGDEIDWSYGELGIPSFTIEIGGMEDGFFWPPYDLKDQLYQELRPALIYAALAADRPYQVAGGPEARRIAIDVDQPQITVRALISDRWSGGDRIASAELFLETLGTPGTGVPLSPVDGRYNYQSEWAIASLDDSAFLRYAGRRVPLIVVAEDDSGKRGVPTVAWLDLREYVVPESQEVKLWTPGAAEPTFVVRNGYVYQGPADAGNILMTVRDGRVYRGAGTLGEVLYTLGDGQVRAGESGPIIYSERAHQIYQGRPDTGVPLYRADNDRLLESGTSENAVVLTANVNLTSQGMETVCLLLPVLTDHRY
ncbi:MAG: M14 family metallopeptidase [Anaerolineae bacterium]